MKRVIQLLAFATLLSAFAVGAQAQLELVYDSLNATVDPNAVEHNINISLRNNGQDTISVDCYKLNPNPAQGHTLTFCWYINCYDPSVTKSQIVARIAPGETDPVFKGTIFPGGANGQSDVGYRFVVTQGGQDTQEVQLSYNVTNQVTSRPDFANASLGVAYPNPATNYVTVDYEAPISANRAVIKIYDLLGKQVKQVHLPHGQSSVRIGVRDLQAGIYFYSLELDQDVVATRRLVVGR